MKKCRPVVKEPSGGTLLFRCALPARGASRARYKCAVLPLLCLGVACTGCILRLSARSLTSATLPRRCLHGVHQEDTTAPALLQHFASALPARGASTCEGDRKQGCCLCLGAACTGCIPKHHDTPSRRKPLPRRCLHGVHPMQQAVSPPSAYFASALPARGASALGPRVTGYKTLCLGAACTGCISRSFFRP